MCERAIDMGIGAQGPARSSMCGALSFTKASHTCGKQPATRFCLRLRKVDFVLAVGIWVGFGPELGSENNSPKINKKLIFMHSISQIYP